MTLQVETLPDDCTHPERSQFQKERLEIANSEVITFRVKVQTLASSLSVTFTLVSVWKRFDYGSIDGNLPVFSDSPVLDFAPFHIISKYNQHGTCSSSIC